MKNFEFLAIEEGHASQFMKAKASVMKKLMDTPLQVLADMGDTEEKSSSYLLTMYDQVAVITIAGGLTNKDSWINQYFGITSYSEIRKAIIEAMDNGAGCILFNISSPGGDVGGMSDTANLISSLPVKTIAFTSGSMSSAAYFLGCQADYVYADSFAEVGSVGVIIKAYDITEMNKKDGVKALRFRSGDLKGTGDPNFKLSEKEISYVQGKVDMLASMFYEIVSDARGMSLPILEKFDITSGKTFTGAEALAVNLIDELKTLDKSMLKAYTLAANYVDKNKSSVIQYR